MHSTPPLPQTDLGMPQESPSAPGRLAAADHHIHHEPTKVLHFKERRRAPSRRLRRFLALVLIFVALLGGMGLQHMRTGDLEQRLAAAQARVIELDGGLQQLRAQSSTHSEVETLGRSLDGAQARVSAIETGSVAPVVAKVANSIALIQGQYMLVDPRTARPLRLVSGNGESSSNEDGSPRLTMAGKGPVYLTRFSGTAFVVDEAGTLLTNRHVALPWEHGASAQAIEEFGVRPMVVALRGFLPGEAEPFSVSVVGVSSEHDLAILRGKGAALTAKPLHMAQAAPAAGDAALVLGYPTGLSALLARADAAFIAGLRKQKDMDDLKAAEALAKASLIQPLVSRGIVAQVTGVAVVYDAQTTQGGSGGPVVNLQGEVLAITRAVMEGFNGSNLGVPAAVARDMLAAEKEDKKRQAQLALAGPHRGRSAR